MTREEGDPAAEGCHGVEMAAYYYVSTQHPRCVRLPTSHEMSNVHADEAHEVQRPHRLP